jgi:hypothetical protein
MCQHENILGWYRFSHGPSERVVYVQAASLSEAESIAEYHTAFTGDPEDRWCINCTPLNGPSYPDDLEPSDPDYDMTFIRSSGMYTRIKSIKRQVTRSV